MAQSSTLSALCRCALICRCWRRDTEWMRKSGSMKIKAWKENFGWQWSEAQVAGTHMNMNFHIILTLWEIHVFYKKFMSWEGRLRAAWDPVIFWSIISHWFLYWKESQFDCSMKCRRICWYCIWCHLNNWLVYKYMHSLCIQSVERRACYFYFQHIL